MWALKGAYRTRRKEALGGFMNPMRAEARFYLSKDRLLAYACMFPPENGGEDLTLEDFLEDMHYEGIVYGILEETIPQNFEQGYFHVFPVARGTPSQDGEDGKVIELFQRRGHMRLEVQNGSEVDFGQESQLQPIRRGTVICQILPPKEGADGMDVAGVAIPGQPAVSASVPQGKNLLLAKDGSALTAGVDGILYIENDQFCIHEQKIIDGDLDHFQGTLQVSGNLYIGGNVDGGASIVATGDIVINGKVGQARVTSTEGIIRVQQGIYGTEGKTVLAAASQIQSPVVEGAEVSAGTSVITEAISNSVIRCGSTVYAMTGRGLIVNSQIRAGESILCLRIGNLTGGRSRFSVGYPPEIPETWERIRAELAEAQSVIERLWEPIINLRRKGSRISDGEKALLARLVEQRELYVKKLEDLKVELREVNKALDKKSKGKIRCEKLFPILDVQIGRLTEEIITIEEKCNIHVEENSLRMT
ncbi:MAG: FapA family protein [Oscillospiraceae bacterium]|nr:FapA family protein [Oscillospiraceae bacterium]